MDSWTARPTYLTIKANIFSCNTSLLKAGPSSRYSSKSNKYITQIALIFGAVSTPQWTTNIAAVLYGGEHSILVFSFVLTRTKYSLYLSHISYYIENYCISQILLSYYIKICVANIRPTIFWFPDGFTNGKSDQNSIKTDYVFDNDDPSCI